ncbi:Zinc finger BED domain-containing protein 4 [Lucilia cuprina]|nr:Zinc finger BED domain-containing protein 4 [Lucilia cuprina]
MALCKLYQRRCCYLDSKCPNQHVDVRNVIETDMKEAVNGKIWPLSSYGPFPYKQSLPNFIEDQSFEEVRLSFYETKLKNFFGQYHEQYNKDIQEARNKMKVTLDIVNVAINLYDSSVDEKVKNTSPLKCGIGATNNNPFGEQQFANSNINPGLSTTNNNNNVLELPIFTPTMQKTEDVNKNNPFAKENSSRTSTNNNNNILGLPIFASTMQKTEDANKNNPFGKENSACISSQSAAQSMQLPSSSNHNPYRMVKPTSTNTKPDVLNNLSNNKLVVKEPFANGISNIFGNSTGDFNSKSEPLTTNSANLNNPFGKENSQTVSSNTNSVFENNTENPSGMTKSNGAILKPVPTNNFNNFLEKKTSGGANLDKLYGIENSKPVSSKTISEDKQSGVATFKTSNNFNNFLEKQTSANSKNPFGIKDVVGAKSKTVPSAVKSHNTNNRSRGVFNTKTLSGNENITGFNFSLLRNNLIQNEANENVPNALPISSNVYTEQGFWPDDHVIAKQIDKSLMDLILVDMLPCCVVDGKAFQRLKFADPTTTNSRYKQKSQQFFSSTLRPETYNNVRAKVLTMTATPTWISLTIDNWSFANNSNLLLITFTAHFLIGSLRKKLVLAAKVLENDQKDSFIKEKLPEIIKNFKLEEKLHLTVGDKIHNLGDTKIKEFKCVAHTMQLVVNDAIFNNKEQVEEILTKCRKIAKHFETSQQASEYFQTLQEKYSPDKHCLTQDVETNWSITYLMMKRFVEQKIAISFYSEEKGDIENLTTEEWNYLKNIVESLKSIYEATTDLSADTATISVIIPLIKMLESKLEEADAEDHLQNNLKLALNNRFNFIETNPLLIMSTLLDPRFKNKYLSITQMSIAEKEISNYLQMETANTLKTCSKEDKRKSNNTLWEKHDVTIETDISFRNELSLYIHEPLSLRKSNIYMYWNTSRYDKLKKVAEKYLSVPPTIVANEQMLKAAGKLYADRKAYLKDVNEEELLFCHFNIQLLEFDY